MQAGTVAGNQWEASNEREEKKQKYFQAIAGRHLIKAVLFVLAFQACQ